MAVSSFAYTAWIFGRADHMYQEILPPTLFVWGLKNLSYQIPFMAESYLITIPAQSKSN